MDRISGSTGIEGLGDLPFGTHFCLFYETKQDLLETLVGYFKAGLDDHEFCLWITSESIIEEARNSLRQAIPGADKYFEAGDIEIATYRQWYFTVDAFNIPQAIENWNTKLSQAMANGYSRMRAAGDLSWLDPPTWHAFSDYERELDERLANNNFLVVCAYPTKGRSASEVLDIAQTHEYVVAKRYGNWEILETPGLKRTEMEFQSYREEPKQPVKGVTKPGPIWAPILPAILSYSVAILSVIIATIILMQMEINLGAATHVSLYLCVVLLSAWLGGTRPGLLALAFSGLAFDYFFLPPVNSLAIEAAQLPRLVVFVLASFFIVVLSAAQRRAVKSLRHIRDGLKRNIQALQAEIVEREQAEKALRDSETKLKEAQQLAHIGYWDHDLITDRINGSEGANRIFGLQPEGGVLSQAKLLEMIHPDDRQIQQKALSDALQGSRLYDVEYRIIRPDGDIRFVHVRDEIEYDQSGQPIRMFGAVQDITEWKRVEEAIRKSEQVLREAESLGHTGSWEQNLVTGEIFNTEENLRLFFGDDRSKGMPFEDYAQAVHPDDREYVIQRHIQLLSEGGPRDIEYRVVWPDGSVHVIFGLATVVRDELGNAIRVYGTNLDITERKQAEEYAQLQSARARLLADISKSFAEAGLDYQTVLHTITRRTAEQIGDSCMILALSQDRQRLRPVAFHHPDPQALALMQEILSNASTGSLDTPISDRVLAGDPVRMPVVTAEEIRSLLSPAYQPFVDRVGIYSLLAVPLRVESQVIGILSLSRDRPSQPYSGGDQILLQDIADRAALTIENARLFQSAAQQRERLRELSAQLMEARETERRAIARELHDEIGQILSGLMLQLGMAKSHLPKSARSTQTFLEGAEALIQEILGQLRAIIAGLRPQVLDDLGLIPALRRLANEFQADTGAKVEIKADHIPNRLPAPVELALFRIVQEGLTNVRRHAQAHLVSITLEKEDGQVILSIRDDGRGFESQPGGAHPDKDMELGAGWPLSEDHFGLTGIQERTAQLGGQLQVTSAPGQGTTLKVELPLVNVKTGSDDSL